MLVRSLGTSLLLTATLLGGGVGCTPAAPGGVGASLAHSGRGKSDGFWPDGVTHVDDWFARATGRHYGVTIYFPPSYDRDPGRRYPVVYMQDGQNLFVDDLAVAGVSWDIAGAMDRGAHDGSIPEAIVVGVDSGASRTDDYTPAPDPEDGGGGGDRYLSFLVDELKPEIDANLRTQPDRGHTAIVGSSLGGVIAIWAGTARASTFGLIGALSPATWWADEWLTSHVSYTAPWRIYLDSGDSGAVDDDVELTANLAAGFEAAQAAGEGITVLHQVQPGAEHSEIFWRQRIPGALAFLLAGE